MGRKHKKYNKHSNFWDSALYNNAVYLQYYNRLLELSITAPKWEGFPEEIDTRFLELALFTDGQALFFVDEVVGPMVTRVTTGGNFNIYNIPKNRHAYTINGYSNQLNESNSVLIYNNQIRTNSVLDVQVFAERLSDIDRTIDINVKCQKTPIILECEENEQLSLENAYLKYVGNQPVIKARKGFVDKGLNVLKTDAPYVAGDLQELKSKIWNEALTYLGVTNVSEDKKERRITSEVEMIQSGAIASRYSKILARQQACKEINQMFGYNVSCKYRVDSESEDSKESDVQKENKEIE